MIALLELILVMFLSPVIVLGALLAGFANAIREIFNVPLLGVATSALATSVFLWSQPSPDPRVPWVTLTEVIAQVSVLGVPLWALIGIAGCAILGLSLYVGASARHSAVSN
ncbi:hypothetical protein [Rhodanobacter denitrificans]|uniref:hypothetical protein n=1 Tax=Rhodanobacter denitrificans TaxID=666685 RepID=UPI00022D8482|nr:hypothetical protein [Rhodanobacter denitrificans]UJJ53064.1 hypothetical protein LRK52_18330 [Rhodanobacter denitrificans]